MDRIMVSVIALVAACAAAAMAVFAGGYALYALFLPSAGQAGAAGLVALITVLMVTLFAIVVAMRVRSREEATAREAAMAQAEVMEELPLGLGEFARRRPLLSLGLTALAGLLAARNPGLAREALAMFSNFSRR